VTISINAATPDPHRLRAANAVLCTEGALSNNQAPQRNSVRDASAMITAQATAIPPYFNTLITKLQARKSDIDGQAPYPLRDDVH
jgi:hypothetical protein